METVQASDTLRDRAARLGYPFIDLETAEIAPDAVELVPETVARQERFLPLAIDGEVLQVAMSAPPTPETLDRLRFLLRHTIAVLLGSEEALLAAIDRCYREPASGPDAIDFVEVPDSDQAPEALAAIPDPDSAPIARLVQSIIGDGLRLGASRILILPVGRRVKVAYRVQNAVCSRQDFAAEMLYPVVVRLMAMANLSAFIKVLVGERERKLHVVFKTTRHGLSALIEVAQEGSVVDHYRARAAKLGYAFVALDELRIAKAVVDLVPEAVAREHQVVPVAVEGGVLALATGTVPTPEALERLRFALNRPIALALAPEGAVLAAIDRCYGMADPETADLVLWELAQAPDLAAVPNVAPADRLAKRLASPSAQPLWEHLRAVFRDPMLEIFESLRSGAPLCREDAVSGDLEIVFPQSQLIAKMPARARQYLESKVWVLREAIISRLEHFLEHDALARGLAMAYSQYLAGCQLAEGHRVSINPATASDAWLNFLYGLVIRFFPAVDSNGAMLQFVTERLGELSEKIAAMVDDPALVVAPAQARSWLANLERQTTTDELLDFDSPPIIHLMGLLLAEAIHRRASRIAIVPLADRVEVSHRIQGVAYARESLPLGWLYPLLARLRMFAELSGDLAITVGEKERRLNVSFHATPHGLAALVAILPDAAAIEVCRTQAAKSACEFMRLEEVDVPSPLLKPLPKAVAWKKIVLPLALHDNTLTVALRNPASSRLLDELRLVFKRQIAVVLAPEDDILAAIYRHYHPQPSEPPVSPTARALLGLGG